MVYTANPRRFPIQRRPTVVSARTRWMAAARTAAAQGRRIPGVTGPVYRIPQNAQPNASAVVTGGAVPAASVPRSILSSAAPKKWKRSEYGFGKVPRPFTTFLVTPANALLNTKALLQIKLTGIPGRDPTAILPDVQNRSGNTIYIHGVKIFMDLHNQLTENPMIAEYAVCSPKVSSTINANFFLTNTGSGSRGQAVGSASSGLALAAEKINTDECHVFLHKRVELLHQPTTAGGHTDGPVNIKYGASYRQLSEWIPIKRHINFESMTATSSPDDLFLCLWCYHFKEPGTADGVANALEYGLRAVVYYRNVQSE